MQAKNATKKAKKPSRYWQTGANDATTNSKVATKESAAVVSLEEEQTPPVKTERKRGWLLDYLNEQELKDKVDETKIDYSASEKSNESEEDVESPEKDNRKKPAWHDEDDDYTFKQTVSQQSRKRCKLGENAEVQYHQIAEEKYQSVMGVPKWAKKKVEDIDFLASTGELVKTPKCLTKGKLEWLKLKALNVKTRAEGPYIKDIKFHPRSTVALVAGVSGVASLFAVDGRENAKLQSIQFKRFPISCAAFLRGGEEFLVGSPHFKHYYSHDLISGHSERVSNAALCDVSNTKTFRVSSDGKYIATIGNFGLIHLMSSLTKEFIGSVRMNGRAFSLDFWDDYMYSHGDQGDVYVWDMKTRQCVHKFYDDGCLMGTVVTASPNGLYLATGSSSGVVNIYDLKKINAGQTVSPLKTICNLTTSISCLKFNSTGEILCAASDSKENAVKLLHCSSKTVFDNFPSFQMKCNRVQCVDFSPNSGYFAFGDNKTTAHLFRFKHYGNF